MKTVYILGAGFSVDAGLPLQKDLINEIFRLYTENENLFDAEKFSTFEKFLTNQLNLSQNDIKSVQLEDIFTPLDRCISENSQYRGISVKDLSEVRKAIIYVIGQAIHLLLKNNKNKEYINIFSQKIISESQQRIKNYQKNDPISVISTNWDALLDNTVHTHIKNIKVDAVVDYCCHISSLEDDPTIKPGLEILGRGGFNIKILKIHGSLNWLQCPRCMRLYVHFMKNEHIPDSNSCRHCDTNFPEEKGRHTLYSNLIMPTFIKDFTNPQYKIVWQNAGIEISEADKLVFIGYSLPSADFEMRQLLSRMVRKNAEIEVVDFCNKGQKGEIEKHWQTFFGKRKVSVHTEGAANYIKTNMI